MGNKPEMWGLINLQEEIIYKEINTHKNLRTCIALRTLREEF
jgi:hypothetical protein